MIDCNEWRTEKCHECANMGKEKRLELWWQLYHTSLPVRDSEKFSGRLIFVGQSVEYTLLLSDFIKTWTFSTEFRQILKNINFHEKSDQWEPDCPRRTDRQTYNKNSLFTVLRTLLNTLVKSAAPLSPVNLHGEVLNYALGQLRSCLSCGEQQAHKDRG